MMTLEDKIDSLIAKHQASIEELIALKQEHCQSIATPEQLSRIHLNVVPRVVTVEYLQAVLREHFYGEITIHPTDKPSSIQMDSLDQVELIMYLEDELHIEIADEDADTLVNKTFNEMAMWLTKQIDPRSI